MDTVECPSCGCKLRAMANLQGAQVQCPRCSTTFAGPMPAPAALPIEEAAEEATELDGETLGPPIRGLPPAPRPLKPVLVSSSTSAEGPDDGPTSLGGLRVCPVCGNRDPEGLSYCSVCGSALGEERPEARLPTRRDYEPDRGQLISTLAKLSMFCAVLGLLGNCYWPFALASVLAISLGISALVMGQRDLALMDENVMDPEGRATTESGRAWASLGVVLGVLVGLVRLMMMLLLAEPW